MSPSYAIPRWVLMDIGFSIDDTEEFRRNSQNYKLVGASPYCAAEAVAEMEPPFSLYVANFSTGYFVHLLYFQNTFKLITNVLISPILLHIDKLDICTIDIRWYALLSQNVILRCFPFIMHKHTFTSS